MHNAKSMASVLSQFLVRTQCVQMQRAACSAAVACLWTRLGSPMYSARRCTCYNVMGERSHGHRDHMAKCQTTGRS